MLVLSISRCFNSNLDVPVEEILVGLGADVLDDVADPQDQLILDRRNPRIVVQLQHGARAQEILKDNLFDVTSHHNWDLNNNLTGFFELMQDVENLSCFLGCF